MPGEAIVILALIIATAVVVAAGVQRLYRPLRVIVFLGLLATAVQIYFPPCLGPGQPPQSVGHQPIHRVFSYSPQDIGYWVDTREQTANLLITAVLTVFGCGLAMAWFRPTAPAQRDSSIV